jgi:hypothetical protein
VSSITRTVSRALRKVASIVSSVLPSPPSEDGAPPDVDGRRPSETDVTQINVDMQRKDGKGGYR